MNDEDKIRSALSYIPSIDRGIWVRVAMAVKSALGDAGYALWDRWSQQADTYCPKSAASVWKSIKEAGGTTVATLYHLAYTHGWRDDSPTKQVSQAEIDAWNRAAAARRAIEDEKTTERQQRAAKKAAWIMDQCRPGEHPYFATKGLDNAVGNVWRPDPDTELLIIPMYVAGALVGAQSIDYSGVKKFIFGQRSSGAEYVIDNKGANWFCEGYATALSLRAALSALKKRYTIHVCFSDLNMKKVAMSYGTGFVAADNDVSHAGQKAAEATGLPWIMSDVEGEDLNDAHQRLGLFRFSQRIRAMMIERGIF